MRNVQGRRVTVGLDEGGLRCMSHDGAAYVPYDVIVDATIANAFFGRTVLVLQTASSRDAIRLELANGNPFDVLGAVLSHLTRARTPPRVPAMLRRERALDEWLADVRRLASGAGSEGYRRAADASVDERTLADVIDDADAAEDERAAGVHAMLQIGTHDALLAVTHLLVTRAVPPLVLVGARLGRGGSALVDDDLFEDLRAFLSEGDASAALAAARSRDEEGEQRLVAVLDEVKREVAAAFEDAAAATRARKPRGLPALGRDDSSRWIGRSWGL